ncbi:hypothetical protein QYF61_012151 [Mycteria americana]|uniref:PDZ domain-containing protein n=1 Tax=Mycteria americana TaxID=33587 RepID=A0AAN7RXS7_MYCAM|nr:hypothetical protein QYF61_012151 [Mycteria americana]
MATLYPSLEDMKGHQILQVRVSRPQGVPVASHPQGRGAQPRANPVSWQAQAAAGVRTPATTVVTEKPKLVSDTAPPTLYPNLAELENYMGLALSSEEIQKNLLPEGSTVGALTPAGPPPGQMVAPLSGNNAGLRRAEIKPGVREIHLCKDERGKTGLQLKNVDQVRGVGWHGAAHSTAWCTAARHSMARCTAARHSTAWCTTAQHSTAWRTMARHSMARCTTARHSTAWCTTARHSTACCTMAWHGTARHGAPWHGAARHKHDSTAQHDVARCMVALNGKACHGAAQRGAAWHGVARYGVVGGMGRCLGPTPSLPQCPQGIFVQLVKANSPAALVGLRFGDQILQIDGKNCTGWSSDKAQRALKKASPEKIVMVVRDRPFQRTVTVHKDSSGHVGIVVKKGKIVSLAKDSSAARNGLLTHHCICEVNGQNVIGMKDKQLTEVLAGAGNVVTLTIIPTVIYEHMVKRLSAGLVKSAMDHSVPDL